MDPTLSERARALRASGDHAAAMALLKDDEEICRRAGNVEGLWESLKSQGDLLTDDGDWAAALDLLREADRLCRESGNLSRLQAILNNQANVLSKLGELDEATHRYAEAEQICRELGNFDGLQLILGNQANLAKKRGNLDRALILRQEEENICRDLGKFEDVRSSLRSQALIFKERGDLKEALARFQAEEEICRRLENMGRLERCLDEQASILDYLHDSEGALKLYQDQERICRQLGNMNSLQLCLGNQALILTKLGDLDEAMRLRSEEEQICRKLGYLDFLALSLYQQALILEERGNLDGAMALYEEQEQICRQLGELELLEFGLSDHAPILKKRGDLAGALDLYKEAAQICRQLENLEKLQANLGNQALILKERGDLDGALALHKEEEQICRQLGDLHSLRASLNNQAFVLRERGDLEGAMALFKEEEKICRQLGDLKQVSASLSRQALTLEAQGNTDGAMTLHKEAEYICRQAGNLEGLNVSLGSQASILRARGDLDAARDLLKEQEHICRQLGNFKWLSASLGTQALILKTQGDLDGAMTLHKEEEQICRRLGNDDGLQVCLGNQALILKQRSDLEGALALLQEQERICRELCNQRSLPTCLANQALVLKERGNLDGARALFKDAEQICRQTGNLDGLRVSLGNQALILRKKGDLDGALTLRKEQEQLCRQLGDLEGLNFCLAAQALILKAQADLDGAMALLKETERICRQLANLNGLQESLGSQALILKKQGDLDGAIILHKEEETICRQLGNLDGLSVSLGNQALILRARGDLEGAMRLHKEEAQICRQLGNLNGLQVSLRNQLLVLKAEVDREPVLDSPRPENTGPAAGLPLWDQQRTSDGEALQHRGNRVTLAMATWKRTLKTGIACLALMLIWGAFAISVSCLLLPLIPLLLVWALTEKLYRAIRSVMRKLQATRFRSVAMHHAADILAEKTSLSAAAISFSQRPSGRFAANHVVGSLCAMARVMLKHNDANKATVILRLAVAFADTRCSRNDRTRCRRLLVEALLCEGITDAFRTDCEHLAARDRKEEPFLYAVSEIERAKVTLERWPNVAAKREQAITALKSILSIIPPSEELDLWVSANNLISIGYWRAWQHEHVYTALEHAIDFAEESIKALDKATNPATWATTHLNIGIFYSARASESAASESAASESSNDDIEKSISSLRLSLDVIMPGDPNYVVAHSYLVAALSKRTRGVVATNLDYAITSANLALADPTITSSDRAIFEKSLATLLSRRWGKTALTMAEGDHRLHSENLLSQMVASPTLRLREITGLGTAFGQQDRIVKTARRIVFVMIVLFSVVFWGKVLLIKLLIGTGVAYLFFMAAVAPEGLEKLTLLPFDWLRLILPFGRWAILSKNELSKTQLAQSLLALQSDPASAIKHLGKIESAIDKQRDPSPWAVLASIHAWLSLVFPFGDRAEKSEATISVLEEAGDIFAQHRFGFLQNLVDFGLAKAYLTRSEGDRRANLQRAIDLLSRHVLPASLTGPLRRRALTVAQGLQLLGDAYLEMETHGGGQCMKKTALSCYIESLEGVSNSRKLRFRNLSAIWGMARLQPSRALQARSLNGAARVLLGLPSVDAPDGRELAIACLSVAYQVLARPGFIGALSHLLNFSDVPKNLIQSRGEMEARFEILAQLARAYCSADSDRGVAESLARVCAVDALRAGCTSSGYEALCVLGEILFKESRFEEAIPVYDMAIRHIEAARTEAHLLERRANILRENTEPFDRMIIALVRMKRLDDAFEYAERGKSQSISDLVALRDVTKELSSQPLVQEYAAMQVRARVLGQDLSRSSVFQMGGSVSTALFTAWSRKYASQQHREFHELLEQLEDYVETLRRANPSFHPYAERLDATAMMQVARSTRSAIVLFRVTEAGTYAFITTPNRRFFVSSQTLTRGVLARILRKGHLTRAYDHSISDTLGMIGDVLMKRVYQSLLQERDAHHEPPFDRVVMVPNRAFSVLPLHASWWEESGERQYFLDEFCVTYAPSVSIFKNCCGRDSAPGNDGEVLGLFNPSGDLPFADWERVELARVFAKWHPQFLLGRSATVESLLASAEHCNVLHFSCHAKYDADLLESRLILANGADLTVRMVLDSLRLHAAKLIALSACETAIVNFRDTADEHYGLPVAFLFAGAPSVWGTFWPVADFPTALLLVRAYRNLLSGIGNQAAALRNAQLWLRDAKATELREALDAVERDAMGNAPLSKDVEDWKGDLKARSPGERRFADPYYWAAFHAVGA